MITEKRTKGRWHVNESNEPEGKEEGVAKADENSLNRHVRPQIKENEASNWRVRRKGWQGGTKV
jgi:hypothetical protein